MDVSGVITGIATLKNAIEITKALHQADISLSHAETKMKVAELMDLLVDARVQAVGTLDIIEEKERRIRELEEALQFNGELVRWKDAYFEKASTGSPTGSPYCSSCWETKRLAVHLYHAANRHAWACPSCNVEYSAKRVLVGDAT